MFLTMLECHAFRGRTLISYTITTTRKTRDVLILFRLRFLCQQRRKRQNMVWLGLKYKFNMCFHHCVYSGHSVSGHVAYRVAKLSGNGKLVWSQQRKDSQRAFFFTLIQRWIDVKILTLKKGWKRKNIYGCRKRVEISTIIEISTLIQRQHFNVFFIRRWKNVEKGLKIWRWFNVEFSTTVEMCPLGH